MLTSSEIDQVLDQVERGGPDSFRLVVRRYSLPLRSYIASQLHHANDVDDLAQEVFLAAYRDLGSFRRGEDFGAWLRGIARNKLLVYFRSSSRRDQALERFRMEVAVAVEAELERRSNPESVESIEALLRCISRLPGKLRRVVRAGLDGEKPAMLAEEMATSVNAVYNLHYRANQSLRECVKKELE